MKRKPIKVDWEELERAFDQRDADLVYYLDRVTGHVLLEGEGEEKSFKADEDRYNRGEQAAPSHREDATRAYIRPVTTEQKLEWVGSFVADVPDLHPEFRSALSAALDSDGPAEAVIEALNMHAEGKERWYLYRAERLHEAVAAWLDEEGIAVSEPPPWE